MHISRVLIAAVVAVTLPAFAAAAPKKTRKQKKPASAKVTVASMDEPRRVAEAYLGALAGTGDQDAREYLLGGVTFTAEEASIPNWKISRRDEALKETRYLAPAVKHMHDLDKAGAKALNSLLEMGGAAEMTAITKSQADEILAPTKAKSAAFEKAHPVFAYVARVGKDVYFHPRNPWRLTVDAIDHSGEYTLELHKFHIYEKDGKAERTWPLRVLRMKTEGYDSGWKILPASDWDPDF